MIDPLSNPADPREFGSPGDFGHPAGTGQAAHLHADERAHFIATLGMEHWIDGEACLGRATVNEFISAAPGWPSAAVLLTYADVLIGLLASHLTSPRVSITSSLSTYISRPAPVGTVLDLRSTLTKVGRTVTIGETVVRAAGSGSEGEVLALAVGVFQASPRPQDVVPGGFSRFHSPPRVTPTAASFADHIGLRLLEPGISEIAGLRPDLINSTESLQGGLVGLLGETAAQSFATAALGAPAVVESLEVHYLAAARVGPFRTTTTDLGGGLLRVEVRDFGRDDRTVSVIVARTRPASTL